MQQSKYSSSIENVEREMKEREKVGRRKMIELVFGKHLMACSLLVAVPLRLP